MSSSYTDSDQSGAISHSLDVETPMGGSDTNNDESGVIGQRPMKKISKPQAKSKWITYVPIFIVCGLLAIVCLIAATIMHIMLYRNVSTSCVVTSCTIGHLSGVTIDYYPVGESCNLTWTDSLSSSGNINDRCNAPENITSCYYNSHMDSICDAQLTRDMNAVELFLWVFAGLFLISPFGAVVDY